MKSKALKFGAVGVSSTVIDLAIYSASLAIMPGTFLFSKALGFIGGTAFGFYLNKQWTFSHQGEVGKTLIKYLLLYCSTLILNMVSNQLVLGLIGITLAAKATAFIFATALSAVTNFLVMRRFIFRGQE